MSAYSRAVIAAPVCACALALITACSDGSSAQRNERSSEETSQNTAQTAPRPAVATRAAGGAALPDFASLVEQYGAAVVNVEVVQQVHTRRGLSADDPLLEFFRRFGFPVPEEGPGEMPPARGAGSGFIVSPDGYILTNAHVVDAADEVIVRLTDRREYSAKVIGTDERTDVAVIKIDASELPTVRIGDPSRLRPGEWVLAIGSPFGLDNSATAGIVSATARAVGGESYVPFIQTDVAVNPGNSGGPLFNLDGEVIGINSMIFSRTGGYMGLSFAIPIDVANDVREQLVRTGRVVRGRIGVAIQDVNAQLAESFGLDRPRGALVSAVERGSPAARAKVEPGDVILAVDDTPIERFGELSGLITRMKPGSRAKLTVWRDGKERKLDVRIGEIEEEQPQRLATSRDNGDKSLEMGITVRPLSDEERERADTAGTVLVERASGAAARAGVQPGDIILRVNGKRIGSVQELRKAVEQAESTVALLIERGGAQVFVAVRIG